MHLKTGNPNRESVAVMQGGFDDWLAIHERAGCRTEIRTASTCHDGDIVEAMDDGEATLKRFFKRKDHVLLKPENSRMKPIREKRVEIRGVLVGLLRSY